MQTILNALLIVILLVIMLTGLAKYSDVTLNVPMTTQMLNREHEGHQQMNNKKVNLENQHQVKGQAVVLDVTIENLRNQNGSLVLMIFNSASSFREQDYRKAIVVLSKETKQAKNQLQIQNIKAGTYAISLIHDENNNHQFDMQADIPLEGYAYSNAVGRYRIPTFEQASIQLNKDNAQITMKMIYH